MRFNVFNRRVVSSVLLRPHDGASARQSMNMKERVGTERIDIINDLEILHCKAKSWNWIEPERMGSDNENGT